MPFRSPSAAPSRSNFPELARRLEPLGEVRHNAFMLRFATEGYEFTVFPDGRAIIKGTNDIAKAQNALCAVRGELTREIRNRFLANGRWGRRDDR